MAAIGTRPQNTSRTKTHRVNLLNRKWLSNKTFEIAFSKPARFSYQPGQRIRFIHQNRERDYSLVSAPKDNQLTLCVRHIEKGAFSPILSAAEVNSTHRILGPFGYFTYRKSPREKILVATGTGIAPFASMVRSGIKNVTLLHGVSALNELYYESLFRSGIQHYIPCISGNGSDTSLPRGSFKGRVTAYLETHLPPGEYDFYLCGRNEMIRDVTFLVDERFQNSHVYTEIFF